MESENINDSNDYFSSLEIHESYNENTIDNSQEVNDFCLPATMHGTIKHLVISGGSVWGFSAFGILYEAMISRFLDVNKLESLYLTSVGTIIGIMISLKIDPTIMREYLIQRPWEVVCKKSTSSVLEIYDNKGIVQINFFVECFSPLFKSIDLDVNSTMLDLYNYNGMDIHMYITELNSFTLIDISYKTHPEWRIIDAIHASCTIPIVFTPIVKDNECYVDGGFFMNYPISKCLEKVENLDEILGISLGNSADTVDKLTVKPESNIFDLLNVVLNRVINNIDFFTNNKNVEIPYQIHYSSEPTTIDYCLRVLYSKEHRQTLIYKGINTMKGKMKEWFSTNK
jgi:Patatin-like phospholipase